MNPEVVAALLGTGSMIAAGIVLYGIDWLRGRVRE